MAKILVVDDEPVFCDLLKGLLGEHGHEIFTANNGHEALDLFKQHHPQFTLLDLRMPEMDGIEVLKRVRTIDPQAVVMILTAWGTDQLEQQARQMGAIDFLSKRLTFDAILTKMEDLLKTPVKEIEPGSILLVDDSPQGRERFEPFLRNQGFHVRLAQDGPSALKLVDQAPPHFIVLDMELGGIVDTWDAREAMNAAGFLQALRQRKYKGEIIIMADSANENLLMQVPGIDTFDILGKPVDPTRLMLAIQVGLILTGRRPHESNK